jgi:hypothetical protein
MSFRVMVSISCNFWFWVGGVPNARGIYHRNLAFAMARVAATEVVARFTLRAG